MTVAICHMIDVSVCISAVIGAYELPRDQSVLLWQQTARHMVN